jgi:hypothetical protein
MARSAANSKLNGTFICWANASEGACPCWELLVRDLYVIVTMFGQDPENSFYRGAIS